MPHVVLKMIAGRSEEKKRELAAKLTEAVTSVLGCEDAAVSVALFDIETDRWTPDVYVQDIQPNQTALYKAPGYDPFASE
jgi:4-oxalocrotonate tautomerase